MVHWFPVRAALALILLALAGCAMTGQPAHRAPANDGADRASAAPMTATLRIASFNVAMNDNAPGGVIRRLRADDAEFRKLAAVIQHLRPDIVLLNEFDFDADSTAVALFAERFLGVGQHGQRAISYAHYFATSVNTGEPSGFDLNNNGATGEPEDAWGFGHHPGQYAMLLLSRYPIDVPRARTFQKLKWAAMPGALRPSNPDGSAYWPDAVWEMLRLSSKNHWDVPVATPLGELRILASHPTPPAFDGPEDRNGARNHDEIRLFADYVSGGAAAAWIVDDNGARGGLDGAARFVLLGDQNADPNDGSSRDSAIQQLLDHPRINGALLPRGSGGGAESANADGGANAGHAGDPDADTGAFGPRVGNLRVDYALPSRDITVVDSGVFWPRSTEIGSDWVTASDHRLVWIDVTW